MKNAFLLGLLIIFSSIAYAHNINPFSSYYSCQEGTSVGQIWARTYIGEGNSERYIGKAAVYKRTRDCSGQIGCGPWTRPVYHGPAYAAFVLDKNKSDVEVAIDFQRSSIALSWTKPYADGKVNGCRWRGVEGDGDQYCALYLRNNCMRLTSISLDKQVEYAVFWRIR